MAMNERYEPESVEPHWQKVWNDQAVFAAGTREEAPKKYILEMLPYPSGKMHMGHARNYLIGDALARYFRMKGFDVLHPMGWDAFGLPAENAAIKDGVHPAVRTQENIASFKAEFRTLGFAYDWSREVNTSEPAYYRWNQWFFLRMRDRGLVYRRFSKVNWCTGCLTVIANEQVKEGRCERCDSEVVEKEMPEWAFRITRFSQALLDGLDGLTQWPERITAMQRHWIGRSEGAEVDFAVRGHEGTSVRVFTTRVDTLFGCTYVVVAPDHPVVEKVTTEACKDAVAAFAARMAHTPREERTSESAPKEGAFTGAHALHPFTGEALPIWVANFVVADYGTGAVMSVPAHDSRDFAFAKTYGLPVREVIRPDDGVEGAELEAAFTDDGVLVASGAFSGLTSAQARTRIAEALEKDGKGKKTVTYRQRDWGFSRQRYWGTPIPIIYCDACDPEHQGIPVPETKLPVELPEIDTQAVLTGKGEPPLAKVPSFLNTVCPKCGGPAQRETETMDTFVDSCWYYARYLSPRFAQAPFDPAAAERWLPVDVYVGGPEHAVMHLLYFRFWSRVMREMGLTPVDEPVTRLVTQGIVNAADGRKMSKRWGNVVSPSSIVERYGADTTRAYVLFAGPPERDFNWSDEQVEGAHRFLKRTWVLASTHQACAGARFEGPFEGKAKEIRRAAHKCVKRVGESFERLSFNTAIAFVMELVNALYAFGTPEGEAERCAMAEAIRLMAQLLYPVVPHLSEEIAVAYGASTLLIDSEWPTFDPALVVDEEIAYAVQVNGKLRGEVKVPAEAGEADVRSAAEANEKVSGFLSGKQLRKVVFVPKRLINFVVG